MHLKYRNVNDAFLGIVRGIRDGSIPTMETSSRNGPVKFVPEPVTITYERPCERVLFNEARNCNPFFHVYEALHMLAGRNDIAPLCYYVSTMDQFSDDGKTQNAIYGYRWRHAKVKGQDPEAGRYYYDVDQLYIIINHLRQVPDSRRVVLQMWNVQDDLLKIGKGAPDYSKDVACNLCAMFMLRSWYESGGHEASDHPPHRSLDMTVINRSNDTILGMLGANVVHFSFLQEYIANALGVEVGNYHQISNNMHVYLKDFKSWDPNKWLKDYENRTMHSPRLGQYRDDRDTSNAIQLAASEIPLLRDREMFDMEVKEFVEWHSKDAFAGAYHEPFLAQVAQPMMIAYHYHKKRQYSEALQAISNCAAQDWRQAGTQWLLNVQQKYKAKLQREAVQSTVEKQLNQGVGHADEV